MLQTDLLRCLYLRLKFTDLIHAFEIRSIRARAEYTASKTVVIQETRSSEEMSFKSIDWLEQGVPSTRFIRSRHQRSSSVIDQSDDLRVNTFAIERVLK